VKSDIFEHIRCDRLLEAGFNILSETSYELDPAFVNKYPNLKQINYQDFFNVNIINNILDKKNICFIHSCNLKGRGLKRLEYLVKKIKDSGLIDHLETVYINNIGIPILENAYGDKFNISNYSENPALYEIPTINKILDFSKKVDCNIVYLHTKGISFNHDDQKENDWIDMMLYFIVEKYELCFEKLQEGIEAVGCNYYDEKMKIRNPKHFSGNFWWANSQYISTLPSLIEKTENVNPNDAEFWLCKNNPSVYEMHCSNVNHYNDVYPLKNYQSCHITDSKLNKPKIIDCFTFYNEIEMLTYRLNVLDEIVDYFILVEATHTHIGKEKPLFYQENKDLFEKFNHKIIHVVVDDFPHKFPNIDISKDEQWINERFQRDCISRGLDKLSLQNDDVITITDLDEIPNPNILEKFKNNEISVDVNIIKMDFYYYNLNSRMDHDWFHAKVLTFKKYNELKIGCDKIRFYKCPIINNGGWHLSYFGNEKFIKNKLENFGHQEYNHNKFTNEELIIERVKSGKDLFDRAINIINMPIKNNDNLPPKYDIYLTNFYN
jgi:beta-1,4-mannosyl-glycoprotein beta-1,4-N-acetylglucosaminyltransferase